MFHSSPQTLCELDLNSNTLFYLGATGFTGAFIVEYLAARRLPVKRAIAGRSADNWLGEVGLIDRSFAVDVELAFNPSINRLFFHRSTSLDPSFRVKGS